MPLSSRQRKEPLDTHEQTRIPCLNKLPRPPQLGPSIPSKGNGQPKFTIVVVVLKASFGLFLEIFTDFSPILAHKPGTMISPLTPEP